MRASVIVSSRAGGLWLLFWRSEANNRGAWLDVLRRDWFADWGEVLAVMRSEEWAAVEGLHVHEVWRV